MTLTHSCDLPWVTSSNADSKTDVGLSEFGAKVVKEMNRMGMIVDLSHVSTQTMRGRESIGFRLKYFKMLSAIQLLPLCSAIRGSYFMFIW